MKKKILLMAILVVGLMALSGKSFAEDPLIVGPDIYKLRFENEKVRVMEITFAPGDSIGMHSHPDHLAYFLTDGKLVISYPDGTAKNMEGKAGDMAWISAETHAAVNPGETEVKGLVIEFKTPTVVAAPVASEVSAPAATE